MPSVVLGIPVMINNSVLNSTTNPQQVCVILMDQDWNATMSPPTAVNLEETASVARDGSATMPASADSAAAHLTMKEYADWHFMTVSIPDWTARKLVPCVLNPESLQSVPMVPNALMRDYVMEETGMLDFAVARMDLIVMKRP